MADIDTPRGAVGGSKPPKPGSITLSMLAPEVRAAIDGGKSVSIIEDPAGSGLYTPGS